MNIFGRLINGGFSLFFGLIIMLALGGISSYLIKTTSLAPVAVILLVVISLAVMHFLGKLEDIFKKKFGGDSRKYTATFACMAGGLLLVQIMIALLLDFTPRNDLSYICQGAKNVILNGADHLYDGLPERHQHYFAVYPNNHMLYFIIYILYKTEYFITGNISDVLPITFNVLSLNISYILMYKCAKLIYSPEKALTCAVRGLMFTPVFTYSQFFYTDSMSMPWLTAAVYLYLKWRKQYEQPQKEKCQSDGKAVLKSVLTLFACGALLAAAYKLKGSAIILIPAMLIDLFIRRKGFARKICPAAAVIAAFAVVCLLLGCVTRSALKISDEELEQYKFPLIHWVMMSADGSGGYQVEDFHYTKSYDGYDNKVTADIDRLSQKIENQGVSGFLLHLCKKLSYTWRDGGYMAGYYLSADFFRSSIFYVIASIMHFSLLFTIFRSFASKIRTDGNALSENFVLKIMFIGITLFLLIWEARCRYLVSFFMLFALI